jgi:hypothetical protein
MDDQGNNYKVAHLLAYLLPSYLPLFDLLYFFSRGHFMLAA